LFEARINNELEALGSYPLLRSAAITTNLKALNFGNVATELDEFRSSLAKGISVLQDNLARNIDELQKVSTSMSLALAPVFEDENGH
jgi:hypothetical protein